MRFQAVQIRVVGAVDFLLLEGLKEALAASVVVRVSFAAHATDHLVAMQQVDILTAGVLHALVGVMDHARWRLTIRDGPPERAQRDLGVQAGAERPADNPARVGVQDDGQIDELPAQPDVGEVGYPQLVHAVQFHRGAHVGKHAQSVFGRRGHHELSLAGGQQILGAHQPPDSFFVDDQPPPVELLPHAPIAVVATMLQADALNPIPHFHVVILGRLPAEPPVIACSIHLRQAAHPFDR